MLNPLRRSLPALAALDDELRRALYLYVRKEGRPVTRDEAAAHTGISTRLAAFHLDKLVKKGLLGAHYARKPGRSGPGAGRSSKYYTVSDVEIDVTIPERRYEFVGEILVAAIAAEGNGESARSAALRITGERGHDLGRVVHRRIQRGRLGRKRSLAVAEEVLADLGFEPFETDTGIISLRNCPFHRLARQSPDLVCAMNHAFVDGLMRGLGATSISASLEPTPGQCCVKLKMV
jgi:predicted ArsR family transcriptional regulator